MRKDCELDPDITLTDTTSQKHWEVYPLLSGKDPTPYILPSNLELKHAQVVSSSSTLAVVPSVQNLYWKKQ